MDDASASEWVKLQLDVTTFNESTFAPYVVRCTRDGIKFCTMSDLGDTAEHRVSLFEFNRECSADIPGRGAFYTFDEYLSERIEVSTYNPRGVVIALQGDLWVGMAAISDCRAKGYVFSEMTGVKRNCRGRGIAISMKTLGVEFVRECGVDIIRTVHNSRNTGIITMNKKLGYVEGNWNYP